MLERTLREEGMDAIIEMVRVRDDGDAIAKRFLGSPSIRINDADPFAQPNQTDFGMHCRLYSTPNGLKGAPTQEMLRAALVGRR